MRTIFWILLFVAVVGQASVTTFPLFLSTLLLGYVFWPSLALFVGAFFLGMLLDMLTLQPVGLSSAMGISFLFLVFLYERKFEIRTPQFVFAVMFLASLLSFLLLYHHVSFLASVFTAVVVCLVFFLLKKFIMHQKSSLVIDNLTK